MGFEMGFAKHTYDENRPYCEDDYFWTWCGWDFTDLFEAFSQLPHSEGVGVVGEFEDNNEYKIPVKDFDFIYDIHYRLYQDDFFRDIQMVSEFEGCFADELINNFNWEDKLRFYKCFDVALQGTPQYNIASLLAKYSKEGYYIVETLVQGLDKAKAEDFDTIVLYKSY